MIRPKLKRSVGPSSFANQQKDFSARFSSENFIARIGRGLNGIVKINRDHRHQRQTFPSLSLVLWAGGRAQIVTAKAGRLILYAWGGITHDQNCLARSCPEGTLIKADQQQQQCVEHPKKLVRVWLMRFYTDYLWMDQS
uniref:Uncharacterized protein n=1 Tax=Globodera rostochiensis TaxID=31243 RepID=A0A914HNU2_GLORO